MSDILFHELEACPGYVGETVLNRPAALNALTLKMVQAIYQQLMRWRDDPKIKAVLIRSDSKKAFCAGGDIKAIYKARGNLEQQMLFFTQEYALCRLIQNYPKPYLAFWEGIVMGGGVGISLYAQFRICGTHLAWAMPEVLIGFYPDVGVAYCLSRLPRQGIGYYLGITGQAMGAREALNLGVATHYVPQEHWGACISALRDTYWESLSGLHQVLLGFQESEKNLTLSLPQEAIAECFNVPDPYIILAKVQQQEELCQVFDKVSPTSLYVTFECIQRASHLSFEEVLAMNQSLTRVFLQKTDFYEGVRSAIIDKDRDPCWSQAPDDHLIKAYFG